MNIQQPMSKSNTQGKRKKFQTLEIGVATSLLFEYEQPVFRWSAECWILDIEKRDQGSGIRRQRTDFEKYSYKENDKSKSVSKIMNNKIIFSTFRTEEPSSHYFAIHYFVKPPLSKES